MKYSISKRNDIMQTKHTFVICAYKESRYLEDCILSLKKQTVHSELCIATSTPNDYIQRLAVKYQMKVYVNRRETGITQDWNFGLSQVRTKYATIAHQDDIYETSYTQKIIENMESSRKPLIAFSDYYELRNGKKVYDTSILKIKRLMMLPLQPKAFWGNRFIRRRVLSLGDPICCPAVTFCMENLQQPIFQNGFRSCEDWEAWEKLSKLKGDFVYVPEPLMCHRIHEESATTEIIRDNARAEENYMMYCKFWPKWVAGAINHFYTKSENSNQLK